MPISLRRSKLIIRRKRKPRSAAGSAPVENPAQTSDPAIAVFTTPWSSERGRAGPLLLSLGIHVLVVTSVFAENYLRPPLELQLVAPEQLLADKRYELTWPVFRNDLPPVEPLERAEPTVKSQPVQSARPRFLLPQRVVADDPTATSQRQMVWDQAPRVELNQDVRSPNFIEWSAPRVQRLRFDLAEGQIQSPVRQALAGEQAPQVRTAAQQALAAASAVNAPRLRYWATESEPAAPQPQRRALAAEATPSVAATPGQGLDIGDLQQTSRLRYWEPQQGADEPGRRALGAGPAPQVQATPNQGVNLDPFQRLSRLRYQQAEEARARTAETQRALAAGENVPVLGAATSSPAISTGVAELAHKQALASVAAIPPPPGAQAGPGRAVVGVDPDPNVADAPSGGRRAGNFTAGPDGGANTSGEGAAQAGESESATLARVRIPHLSVSPASQPTEAPSGLSGGTSPSRAGLDQPSPDRDSLLRQFRDLNYSPAPAIGVAVPERLPDPELPFPGRAVYTLAVNMPNISSYSGSWIIEFAEVNESQGTPGELLPPSPRMKVDPVYSRAAIDERIEGDVVLHATIRSDGLVDHIKVIKRLDARLDESAQAALAKWRFHPATKKGVPVDVETVVRIPFRLAPRENERR